MAGVNYLNTKPLIYGFEKGLMKDELELFMDYPSNIATMLLNDEVDIGLMPVATIPSLKENYIISNYCIGCNGDVASVCVFSNAPLKEIKTILLDYQSRSSVALLKVLIKDYWKISPQLIEAAPGFEEKIDGTTAALIIGDRALALRKKYKFVYDLGGAWKQMTKLPFVFAAWVANKKLPDSFIDQFNKTTSEGLNHFDEIIATTECDYYDLDYYYHFNISYTLDAQKKKGLEYFLSKME